MNITFVNGSNEQQAIARAVFGNFLNLNLDQFALDLDVEFIADPGPQGHNEFAFTDVNVGSAVMSIRTDFPRFNPVHIWGSTQFANEVVAHEAGHALLGQLSESAQQAIAEMFGTTPDNWNPENAPWEDRPLEGIIETFKDAFYPNELREFFNRTNHRIPIDQYPAFRALWRATSDLPEYDDLDLFREDGYSTPAEYQDGGGIHNVRTNPVNYWDQGLYYAVSIGSITVRAGATLHYSFPILGLDDDDGWFVDNVFKAQEEGPPQEVNEPFGTFRWAVTVTGEESGVLLDSEYVWFLQWFEPEFPNPGLPPELDQELVVDGNRYWTLAGGAVPLGVPPVTIEEEFTVPTTDIITVTALLGPEFSGNLRKAHGFAPDSDRFAHIRAHLPEMLFSQHVTSAPELPAGEMAPGPGVRGQVKAPHRVMGHARIEGAP